MNNVTNINKNAPDTRPIETLSPEEVDVRARASHAAMFTAMEADDVEGVLAALIGYSNKIDMMSYIAVKGILQHHMRSCYRVCYAPSKGWYDAGDEFLDNA